MICGNIVKVANNNIYCGDEVYGEKQLCVNCKLKLGIEYNPIEDLTKPKPKINQETKNKKKDGTPQEVLVK